MGGPVAGWLTDRIGRRRPMILGLLLEAAVAQFKPFVFRHFQASPVETAVRLTRIPTEHHDLYVRWGLLAETRDEVGASA